MPDDNAPKTDDSNAGDEGTPKTEDTPTDSGKAPKWDGEFDPERAARLVENLRADLAKRDADLKAAREQIDAKGGSEKTLQDRLEALEKRAADAERDLLVAKVAKEHKVPDDLLEFLTGKDEESLKTQAERLASYAKAPADDVPTRPKPKLTPGTGADATDDDFDPKKVADAARRR